MTNKLNFYIVLSISAALIVFVGILGYKYIPQNFLHNKFATWEMASISMSIFINFLVSQRCKEWMLPYLITGDQLRPWKKLRGKFFSALILLVIVFFMIFFHNYLRTFFDQKWPNLIGGDVLIVIRLFLVLLASYLFLMIDKNVLEKASDAITNDLPSKFLFDKEILSRTEIERIINSVIDSFEKSKHFSDIPTVFGFAVLAVYGLFVALGKLGTFEEGQLCIWVCGASAFQLITSTLVFGLITAQIKTKASSLVPE